MLNLHRESRVPSLIKLPELTVAAGILQKAGMIGYHRGAVKVVNRGGLEGAACECYATIRAFELASQFGVS